MVWSCFNVAPVNYSTLLRHIAIFESFSFLTFHILMLNGSVTSKFKVKVLPSPFLINMEVPISVSLAFGPHICVSTVNATVGGWPPSSTVCLTPVLFPKC